MWVEVIECTFGQIHFGSVFNNFRILELEAKIGEVLKNIPFNVRGMFLNDWFQTVNVKFIIWAFRQC